MATTPRCGRCGLKPALCMCEQLPQLATKTHVSLLIHKMELLKSTNTGRLAAACLRNCSVHAYGNDLPDLPKMPWLPDTTPVVLFPLESARPVADFLPAVSTTGVSLLVLDGSWHQANRLRKRFAIAGVPFVACPVGDKSIYRLRAEPKDHTLCTLEAIGRALSALGEPDANAALLQVLRVFQDRTLWTRGALKREDVCGGIPDGALRHAP